MGVATRTLDGWMAPPPGQTWTAIGTIASPARALVDATGLLTPRPGSWSVDWWIGAEDRWHFPCQEKVVRQGLLGHEPVVETTIRIPGGEAVARAYALVATGIGDVVVLEVENRSPTPIAVAFAVRPFGIDGGATVSRVEVGDDRVVVDGVDAILLPRPPGWAGASTLADGDVAAAVQESRPLPRRARCNAGAASAAAVFPLVHHAAIRVAVPLRPTRGASLPPTLATAADAARAWAVQAGRGMRADLPAGRLTDAFEVNRRWVLQSFAGDSLVIDPSRPNVADLTDVEVVLAALDELGFHAEAADVLGALPGQQRFDGSFGPRPQRVQAAEAMIRAAAIHWRLTGENRVLPAVALAARCVARSRPGSGSLADAADLLDAAGETRAARECRRLAGPRIPPTTGPTDGVVASARFVRAVRRLLVDDDADTLAILREVPSDWLLEPVEVRGAPTRHGVLSFAVRWHGRRPALLWEVSGDGPVRITAPGLAPGWETDQRRGEEMLT